jgi:hypothetical protein
MPNRSNRTLEEQLAEIPKLDASALSAGWTALFGRPPPANLSKRLLEHAAAYHAQAKVHGGLSNGPRRKLIDAGRRKTSANDKYSEPKRRSAMTPGSRLVREWHGRSHTVEVAERGFLYAGQRYRSLSAVARIITGSRWSGPRFFGL